MRRTLRCLQFAQRILFCVGVSLEFERVSCGQDCAGDLGARGEGRGLAVALAVASRIGDNDTSDAEV